MEVMDGNAYHRAEQDGVLIDWRGGGRSSYETLEQFQEARRRERSGVELSGEDPFRDRAAGDFRLRRDSAAAEPGRPLPEPVAEALDLEPGSRHPRGALTTVRSTPDDAA